MADEKGLDTLLGEPRAAIRSMVIPFLISIATVQINVFADTFWVSGLGVDAVSGMTSAIPLYSVFSNIAVGLSVGAVSTIAFRLGKRDRSSASRLAGSAITTGIVLSALCSTIVFVLLNPIVDVMGAQDVRKEIFEYVLPIILLSPAVVLNTVFGGLLRAEGNARRSTIVQMSAAIINMALDPVLIYGAGLGIAGAGLATALSSCFGVAIAARWYMSGKTAVTFGREDLKPDLETEKELMTVAGPRTLEGLTMSVVILFQRVFIIMAGGTVGVALFNVPFRYVNLSMCPCEATGMAMVPVASSAYGQGDLNRMRTSMAYALKLVISMSLVLSVALFILSEPLISLLTTEPSMEEWKDAFVWNMMMYSIIPPFFALQTIGSSMLQSMKRSKRPMEVTMLLGIIRMFLFWICSGYDYRAITFALIFSYVLSATLMMILARYEFRKIEKRISQGA